MVEENVVRNAMLDTIVSRRSIRRFQPKPVEREVITMLLQAAIWAPSAHNRQPWRFCVIDSVETKERLASAMGARLRSDSARDGIAPELIEKDATRSYSRMTGAPVLIVLSLSMIDMDHYSDEARNLNEYIMAAQSTAMAGQNLLLAAQQIGLATCWMCAPMFCPDVVRDILNLPDDWQPQALIALGYAAEIRTKTRKPLEASVLWR